MLLLLSCFQWFKDTKMRANHNHIVMFSFLLNAVSNGSKILKWEQITTVFAFRYTCFCCFQWFKDTKMRANHNSRTATKCWTEAVSNGSKILKWEQITTVSLRLFSSCCCFQWFKDTKMRANHNWVHLVFLVLVAVSNGSKILKWEQITTVCRKRERKAMLFPMVQRY